MKGFPPCWSELCIFTEDPVPSVTSLCTAKIVCVCQYNGHMSVTKDTCQTSAGVVTTFSWDNLIRQKHAAVALWHMYLKAEIPQ